MMEDTIIRGTTQSGFEFAIDRNAADDWETLKIIRKTNDDASYIVDLAERLLGPEQVSRLEEHCRVDGKVSIASINNEITEMLDQAEQLKNSQPSPA